MADAVHFLCRVDPNMPPVTFSGCNGFNFLTKWGSPSGGPSPESYPIVVPLEEKTNATASIARWHKRVKKWKLTTNAFGTDGLGTTYALQNGVLLNGLNNPTRELQNIANPANAFSDRIYLPTELVNGSPVGVVGQLSVISGGSFYNNAGAYSPFLQLFIPLTAANIRFSNFTGTDPSMVGSIDGLPITVFWEPAGGAFTFTMSQFDLVPDEYWPYAAKDGSPIYNTTTGAVLQDPRN